MDEIDPTLLFLVQDEVQCLTRDRKTALIDQGRASKATDVWPIDVRNDHDVRTRFDGQIDAERADHFAIEVEPVANSVRAKQHRERRRMRPAPC